MVNAEMAINLGYYYRAKNTGLGLGPGFGTQLPIIYHVQGNQLCPEDTGGRGNPRPTASPRQESMTFCPLKGGS
jgi:hypothetical protein